MTDMFLWMVRAGDHRRLFADVRQLSKISILKLIGPKLPVALLICRGA